MINIIIYLDGLKFEVEKVEQFIILNELAEKHGLQRNQNELKGNPSKLYFFLYDLTSQYLNILIS